MPKVGTKASSRMPVSIREIKAARALLGWSQEDLARAAKVSIATVKRLEARDGLFGGRDETAGRICDALKRAGVAFVGDEESGYGVAYKRPLARPRKAKGAR